MVARTRRVPSAYTKPNPNENPASQRWTGDILDLTCIGRGISAMIFIIDDARVIKVNFGSNQSKLDMETERRAFTILEKAKNRSPHIVKCFEADNPRGIVIERCHETLRARLRSMPKNIFPSTTEARRWAKQAAEGLAFIHEHEIIHADVGCHNMLLTLENELKVCDFGGSSVDNSFAATKYEVWSRPPGREDSAPTKLSDLFALGSAIYEMATKDVPYHGKSMQEIPTLYQKGKFPSVKKIIGLGHIITKCWLQHYITASDIFWEIDPQNSLCCGIQERSATKDASLIRKDSDNKVAKDYIKPNADDVQKPVKSNISSPNSSLSSSSFSKPPAKVVDALKQMWSTKRYSFKSSAAQIDKKRHLEESKEENQAVLKSSCSRNNRKSKRKRIRQQPHLSQWINKSLQPYGNHYQSS